MLYLNQREVENFVKYVKVKESGFMVTVTNAENDKDNKDGLLTAIMPLDLKEIAKEIP